VHSNLRRAHPYSAALHMAGEHCLATKHGSLLSLETHVGFCSTQVPCNPLLQPVTWQRMLWLKSLSKRVSHAPLAGLLFRKELAISRISRDKFGCTDQQRTLDCPLDVSPQMFASKFPDQSILAQSHSVNVF